MKNNRAYLACLHPRSYAVWEVPLLIFVLFSAMAGPITRRFVEAIEYTIAHEILQTVKNRPVSIVFYMYIIESHYAEPHSMISKYESGMTDNQFKVRTFGRDEGFVWDQLEPIFEDIDSCSKYIATLHTPEPDRYCIGTRTLRDFSYPMGPIYVGDLANKSTAREWLLECSTMYADYLMETGLAEEDDHDLQWSWIEDDEDHFQELLENQIDFLSTLFFTGMDF